MSGLGMAPKETFRVYSTQLIFLIILPNVRKSEKIIQEINETNNICVSMEPPEDLKRRSTGGGSNFSTQDISGLLGKLLTPYILLFHV